MELMTPIRGARHSRLVCTLAALGAATLFLSTGCSGAFSKNNPAPALPLVITPTTYPPLDEGQSLTLTVQIQGTTSFQCQWLRDGKAIPGANLPTLVLPPVQAEDDGVTYAVRVTSPAGTTEKTVATLRVIPRLAITLPPSSQTLKEGQPAVFAVAARGKGTLSYQWHVDGTPISEATSREYRIAAVNDLHHGLRYHVTVTGSQGVVTSAPALLTVLSGPRITRQPADAQVEEGQVATFAVEHRGTAPFTYQWQRNGSPIPGAVLPTFTTQPLPMEATDTRYTVQVVNAHGTVSSREAHLKVTARPVTFIQQPTSATLKVGETATFAVAVTGTGPLRYQWQKDGVDLSGATAATLSLPSVQTGQAGTYRCVVTGAAGSVPSQGATLTVNAPVVFTRQPASITLQAGQTATFRVAVTGTGPLRYQWQKDDVNLSGATAATLSLPSVQTSQAGAYRCVVTGALGSVPSQRATLTVNAPVVFTQQPAPATVKVGQTATFTVAVTGTGPFRYQWQKDGVDLSGANTATLTLANLQVSQAGAYRCVVTGAAGSVASQSATLTVEADSFAITVQPSDQTVIAPAPATFTVTATGSNLSYQWAKDGAPINGATSATYTTEGMDFKTEGGRYSVTVTQGGQNLGSQEATVIVRAPEPTYAGDPVAQRPLTVLPSFHVDPVRFPNGSFRFGYSEELKNALWTSYAIFRVSSPYPNGNRKFRPDTRLQAPHVTDDDMGTHGGEQFYLGNGQGFDRGHLVTMSDLSYRYNRAKWADGDGLGEDSCRMSNIVPQTSYHNQRIWQDLEETVGGSGSGTSFSNGVTRTLGRAWIYSGPIFEGPVSYWFPATKKYGTNPGTQGTDPAAPLAIGIPTALYKVVVAEPGPGQTLPRVMAWVSSNREQTDKTLRNHLTSLKRVEELTGLDLFPRLTKDADYQAWRAQVDVRGFGAPFEQASGPNVHMVQPSYDLVPNTTSPVLKGHVLQVGDSLSLEGAASPNSSTPTATVDSPTWTFSDGGSASGWKTSRTFTTAGTHTVTFTVTDSQGQSNSISRKVTVQGSGPADLPPVIDSLAHQTTALGIPAVLAFKISDDKTPAANLTVGATSSALAVLPDSGIQVQHLGNDVTLTLTPAAAGVATVTVTVGDGTQSSTRSFTLNVTDPNADLPPVLGALGNQTTTLGTPLTVDTTVSDDKTPAGNVTVTAISSDQAVLPDSGIQVVNTGGTLALTLTPAATGTTTLTLTANDGALTSQRTFTLTVRAEGTGSELVETFDSGTNKTGYAAGTLVLPQGNWTLTDALCTSTDAGDVKTGTRSLRVRALGKATMAWDFEHGARAVTVSHAKYGSDGDSSWQMFYSTDQGSTWNSAGPVTLTTSKTLTPATFTFTPALSGKVRFEIRKLSGTQTSNRTNFDDFRIDGN